MQIRKASGFELGKEIMEGSHKKRPKKPNLLADTVFSWSLDDVLNERLYKNKVENIPISFQSVEHYFGCYLYPLLEETRAQVHSSMETIYRAPFAKVVSFEKAKPYGMKLYDIKVDYWRNRFNDRGKEPYETLPGDLFVLANAKPETLSDLQRVGRSWAFASVTKVSENQNKDGSVSLYFKIKASKELGVVKGSASLFMIFLVNLIPNGRIWKALHMSKNLKIIKEVLCTDSVAHNDLCSEKNNGIVNKGLVQCLSSGLNESQTGTVLACLEMLHCREKSAVELIWGPPGTGKTKTVVTLLLTLLQMNCRTLVCAPTNVAITEVASRVVNMLTEVESNSLFCSFGEVLLFGNKERLKVGSDVEKIYLDYRLKRLAECFRPQTGWRHCFASMIDFLESKSDTKVDKGMCKSFLELIRDRFVSTASPLRHCISILRTHMAKNYISVDNVQNLVLLVNLVDSFESLLFQDNVTSEALEYIFSHSDIDDISETKDDNSFLLFMNRRECLKVLHSLFASLDELHIPNFMEQESLIEFCFQKASLIFCTASSSYKLHKLAMEPLSIVVIDEAAQLKECESTIPLQLLGVKHAVLVGDECQLPATVKSIVSDEAGFSRSLFQRLSSVGHSKHLLNMQYRMHPSISFFPNSRFYNNMILDAPNLKSRSQEKHYLKGSMFGPYSFINIIGGREEKDEDGRSRKNMVEVAIVSQILRNLYKKWVESKKKLSIGIVSPYAAQVVAIEEKLAQKYNNLDGFTVKVKTVDGFQGGEEDIIILSTVRSNNQQSLEFVSKPQRINVSLTRARHCLWILGNETVLCDNESVWKAVVLDAKNRQCFFNADEDKDLAKAIFEVKKQYDQLDDLLNADSILFRSARWKVLFSDNFLKSFKKLTSVRLKRSALNVLLKLASGWRPKKKNSETICGSSSLQKKYKVENLYVVCTTDIAKDSRYFQVLKIWDILPIEDVLTLANRLDRIINKYADGFINLCKEKCLEGDLEVPKSWPPSLEVLRFKDLIFTKMQNDVADTCDGKSYAENSQVSESLLLMKFYSLSSGVVNHLLSDCEGRELDLPFEVTDQEVEIIHHHKSSFIVGRSGTGKTTVLTMKLFQKEQWHQLAVQGCYTSQSSKTTQSSAANEKKVLHQLFVTVSPKLCYAIKRHVSHLKSFACGGSHSKKSSLVDMIEYDEDEAQFNDIPDSFHEISTQSYPLFITFHKFLIMLDGTLSKSYFERFLDATELTHGHLWSSRSAALQNFIRTKEVNYERFSTLYWPHFNTDLTKRLDASRVFTEIISHVKGGLGAIEACDGKLRREDYVQLSEIRVSNLTRQEREVIYDIFQMYEKLKMENGEFDLADLVIDLHHRLTDGNYEGDLMDFVYVDEVQDLTMSQIGLFKHMCHNVEEGFVFSGDTAQTIARGIDFRFQELRHLFYKKFVLESRANKHDESKEKGQVSDILHLTQNFRTHDGILKLSQSIIDILYHFFPLSIDVLKPESSWIYGEAPVLLKSEENENAIVKIFGNTGNIVGFGAEQVILVRDDSARKEISKIVGKHALVLTIVECKGLEFQDVLLYNFFGSSPAKNQWRVIYDYMNEIHLLDHTLPRGFPGFDVAKHNILCSELKQLYVAVTRTRQRLWVCENLEELSKPMFDYWKKKCLVQVKQLDDTLAHEMQVASSPEEWRTRGIKLYHEHNYEMATMCFERAGDTYWKRRSKAAGLKALADQMRMTSPEKAKSFLREAAEIFNAIGKADSAARCFADLGEYERAARIYLNKCGESELKRAAECFFLAGQYNEAADAYAKGNFFSECLVVCEKKKLFELGLHYINNWKQHAKEDNAMTTRGKGIDRMQLEFLESSALHYHDLTDNRSMMRFVKAFPSITLMRDFLKRLDSLDQLLLLEEDYGNYLEAANIARLKGETLLESDFLGKAGKFREASLKIIFYILAMSLWSSGSKGWPLKKFPQQEALVAKAKSLAKNETDNFHELVCTEVEILLDRQDNLVVLKNLLHSSRRHQSIRGEVLSARKILDAHLSRRTEKYTWEKELIGDLVKNSEYIISKNQVSIDSLVYFWDFWKEKILKMYESLQCLGTPECKTQDCKGYVECCLTCLGVCRLYHGLSPVYVLLIPRADWVIRCLERRQLQSHGKLVSIDVEQLIIAAQKYWSSEVISVGIKVLEKLEALYKLPVKNSDSTFYQSKSLFLIYDVAMYLLDSKWLKPEHQDTTKLQRFVTYSTGNLVSCMFPIDWRNSLRESTISLRRTDALKSAMRRVISEYTMSKNKPTYSGDIGRIAMIILGTGKLNSEIYGKLLKRLEPRSGFRAFLVFLCETIGCGEIIYTCLMLPFRREHTVNRRAIYDYMPPGPFLYILERFLIWAALTQGYVLTTSSSFVEWLIYQDEDTCLKFNVEADRSPALEGVLELSVRDCIAKKEDMIEWFEKTDKNWKKHYPLYIFRVVVLLCLLYVNFGLSLDTIFDFLGKSYVAEQLPCDFYDTLRRGWSHDFLRSGNCHDSLSLGVNVLAAALKKVDNDLVIASFGRDCSRFLCSDAIFIDMTENQCKDDILRKLYPKQQR